MAEASEMPVAEAVEPAPKRVRRTADQIAEEQAAKDAERAAKAAARAEARATAEREREERAAAKLAARTAARAAAEHERRERTAAREAEMAQRKAAREAEAAAKAAAREAETAAKAAARATQRAPSNGKARAAPAAPVRQTALAGALRMLLAHIDGDSAAPVVASQLLGRGRRMSTAPGPSGVKKKARRPSARPVAPPVPPPPAPPPSRHGRAIKRRDMFEADIDEPASSYRSAPPSRKPSVDPSVDMGVPAFAMPGKEVRATGLFGGARMAFRARVVELRKQFPRIVVEYTATVDGVTARHALPEMKRAC
jgi:multidrug efflux pump subunit AcrA (membrane-fusion protein)